MGMYKELKITEPVAKGIRAAYEIRDSVAMAMCVSTFWTRAVIYINKVLEEEGLLKKFADVGAAECMQWDFNQENPSWHVYTYDGFKTALVNQLLAWGEDENGIETAILAIKTRMVQ